MNVNGSEDQKINPKVYDQEGVQEVLEKIAFKKDHGLDEEFLDVQKQLMNEALLTTIFILPEEFKTIDQIFESSLSQDLELEEKREEEIKEEKED